MTDKNSFTVLNCKIKCTDPTYCQSVIGCCEIAQEADIEKLEDLRQSEAFYEQLKDKED
jgi:hypothetical protein